MTERLGTFIKDLRRSRGLSVDQLSSQTGINPSTLRRWEAGQFAPRLPELARVLNILGCATQEQRRVAGLLPMRRGREFLLHLEHTSRVDEPEEIKIPPGPGELWRALRVRQGWSQKQLAQAVGVDEAQVSRWESSKAPPPHERLEVLFAALHPDEEERAFLSSGRVSQQFDGQSRPLTVQECEQWHGELWADVYKHRHAGALDLSFLALQSQLYEHIGHSKRARQLLGYAWHDHAEYLWLHARYEEAHRQVRRALAMGSYTDPQGDEWLASVFLLAHTTAQRAPRTRAGAALRVLLPWRERLHRNPSFYRDCADFLSLAGRTDPALRVIRRSHEICQESGNTELLALSNFVHSRILIRAGMLGEATRRLERAFWPGSDTSVGSLLEWAESFAAVGERRLAREQLSRLKTLISPPEATAFRSRIEKLSRLVGVP